MFAAVIHDSVVECRVLTGAETRRSGEGEDVIPAEARMLSEYSHDVAPACSTVFESHVGPISMPPIVHYALCIISAVDGVPW